jgi:hypothetical protein
MWVKRTDAEVEEERKRERRSRRLGAVLGGIFVLLVVSVFFSRGEAAERGRVAVPVSELLSRLPFAIVAAVICAFLVYKSDDPRPRVVCPKCEATKYDDGVRDCACGGRFENMETMKYVA